MGFIWWALPSLLAQIGLSTSEIASISALAVLPWTFKFLLAPFVDLISLKFFGLKKQLLIYQVMMGAVLFFFENAINSQNSNYILLILLVHGLFAALQDISIDSLAIKNLKEDELGSMNGVMQSGMLVGRSIFGGGGVYLAHTFGLKISIYFLITSIWISLFILQKSNISQVQNNQLTFKKYLSDFFHLLKRKHFWFLMVIAYFATYSYNGISTVAGAVLTKKGASALQYAFTYSFFIPISMSLGALLGGRWSDKINSIKTLKISLILTILCSLAVGLALDYIHSIMIIISSYIIFYFFIGSTTASLYGLLMKKTSKEFAALEFSLFMGIVNLSDSNTSYLTGHLLLSNSFFHTTFIIGLICTISILLLKFLK